MMHTTRMILILILALAVAGPGRAAVWRVNAGSSGAPDGTTWLTAYKTIPAALEAAQAGDEVWVAAGTYPGPIRLEKGISLLGGFTGTEVTRERAHPWAHPTVLDGQSQGTAVTIGLGAGNATVDGFFIVNGTGTDDNYGYDRVGGGVLVLADNARLTRNVIERCTLDGLFARGAGVACIGRDALIAGNIIRNNTADAADTAEAGGVFVHNGSARIANNLFVGDSVDGGDGADGAAILCWDADATITNNTIVACNGFVHRPTTFCSDIAIAASGGSVTVTNNIVANNPGGGISVGSSVSHNLTWQNGTHSCGYVTPGENGNISADPLFVDPENGNYHLLPGSPALDAGSDTDAFGTEDLSGAPRIQGARVDMGAYEFDPSRPHVWRVKRDASGTERDGQSWETAFATLPAALEVAQPGDEVWVAEGTYTEPVRLSVPDVGLYGGFAGTETERAARDAKAHETVIGPAPAPDDLPSVTVASGVPGFVVDGFTVRDGYAGVLVEGYASGTVAHDIITGNANGGEYGSGIDVGKGATLAVSDSVVSENTGGAGAGIRAEGAYLTVARCVVARNHAVDTGGAPCWGGGLLSYGGTATITDSLFASNTVRASGRWPEHPPTQSHAMGGAIAGQGTFTILNTTIVDNAAAGDASAAGGGLYLQGTASVHNTIIAGNRTSGADYNITPGPADMVLSGDSQTIVRSNLFFDNIPASPSLPAGNLSADPLFADPARGDYRLRPGSPALDAGDDALAVGPYDLDGKPRILGPHVDMGAYEVPVLPVTLKDVALALRIAAGLATPSPEDRIRLDVANGGPEGRIDMADAVRLARMVIP